MPWFHEELVSQSSLLSMRSLKQVCWFTCLSNICKFIYFRAFEYTSKQAQHNRYSLDFDHTTLIPWKSRRLSVRKLQISFKHQTCYRISRISVRSKISHMCTCTSTSFLNDNILVNSKRRRRRVGITSVAYVENWIFIASFTILVTTLFLVLEMLLSIKKVYRFFSSLNDWIFLLRIVVELRCRSTICFVFFDRRILENVNERGWNG